MNKSDSLPFLPTTKLTLDPNANGPRLAWHMKLFSVMLFTIPTSLATSPLDNTYRDQWDIADAPIHYTWMMVFSDKNMGFCSMPMTTTWPLSRSTCWSRSSASSLSSSSSTGLALLVDLSWVEMLFLFDILSTQPGLYWGKRNWRTKSTFFTLIDERSVKELTRARLGKKKVRVEVSKDIKRSWRHITFVVLTANATKSKTTVTKLGELLV